MKYVIPLLLLIVTAAIVVFWLGADRPAEVSVVTVTETGGARAATVLDASGYVTARRQATVSAKITGKVVEVLIEEGMAVRQGDVVARLDDSHERAVLRLSESQLEATRRGLDEVRSELELAELTLRRYERLVGEGIAGQSDLDRAGTNFNTLQARLSLQKERIRVAERELAVRRTELTETVIRAPFDGVVISKDAQPGEMVSPVSAGGGFTRTGICTVVDMNSLEIEVDVNESYISRVTAAQKVDAVLDAYPDWHIPAHVITTIPAADRQKATVQVRIGFDDLDPRLLPDMGVKVAFLESGQAESAEGAMPRARLLAPRAAVRRDGEQDVVFIVANGVVERRAVRTGAASGGDQVEIVSGLSAGERVVVESSRELADGDEVKVR